MDKNKIAEILSDLTKLHGVSGNEDKVIEYLIDYFKDFSDKIQRDTYGNLVVWVNSNEKNAETILIDAHLDRVGVVVSDINENGSIEFKTVGGIDARILPYAQVEFLTSKAQSTALEQYTVNGIIIPKDNKQKDNKQKESEQAENKNVSCDDMYIYTGKDKEETEKLISVGTRGIIKSGLKKFLSNRYCSGGMDNRAGITAVIDSVKKIRKDRLKYNVVLYFSAEEEIGLNGSHLVDNIHPSCAIVVDVTHGFTPDAEGQTGVFALNSGAVICRGPNLDNELTLELINIAKENNIPYDIEVAAGHSGTNAWSIQTQAGGIPTMMISIPLKYMHTNVEMLSLDDISATSELLAAVLNGGLNLEEE